MIENLKSYIDKDILNYCIHLSNVEKQIKNEFGNDYLEDLENEDLKNKFEKQYSLTVNSLISKNDPIKHLRSLTKAFEIVNEKLKNKLPDDKIPF